MYPVQGQTVRMMDPVHPPSPVRQHNSFSYQPMKPDPACVFCSRETDDDSLYGQKLPFREANAHVHYFCMLFASGLGQQDSLDMGIMGFLPEHLHKELRRGRKTVCVFCERAGACIGCSVRKCKNQWHFPCGLENGSLNQYFGNFNSYCEEHRPRQNLQLEGELDRECTICYSEVFGEVDSNEVLRTPCCAKNTLFHRFCLQKYALSSALHHFKCPLCNDVKKFQKEMRTLGIYIPDQDAAWELEPDAYHELLERYNRCDKDVCLCPEGRSYAPKKGKAWAIALCDVCGSSGIHVKCAGLSSAKDEWICPSCALIVPPSAEKKKKKKTDLLRYEDWCSERFGQREEGARIASPRKRSRHDVADWRTPRYIEVNLCLTGDCDGVPTRMLQVKPRRPVKKPVVRALDMGDAVSNPGQRLMFNWLMRANSNTPSHSSATVVKPSASSSASSPGNCKASSSAGRSVPGSGVKEKKKRGRKRKCVSGGEEEKSELDVSLSQEELQEEREQVQVKEEEIRKNNLENGGENEVQEEREQVQVKEEEIKKNNLENGGEEELQEEREQVQVKGEEIRKNNLENGGENEVQEEREQVQVKEEEIKKNNLENGGDETKEELIIIDDGKREQKVEISVVNGLKVRRKKKKRIQRKSLPVGCESDFKKDDGDVVQVKRKRGRPRKSLPSLDADVVQLDSSKDLEEGEQVASAPADPKVEVTLLDPASGGDSVETPPLDIPCISSRGDSVEPVEDLTHATRSRNWTENSQSEQTQAHTRHLINGDKENRRLTKLREFLVKFKYTSPEESEESARDKPEIQKFELEVGTKVKELDTNVPRDTHAEDTCHTRTGVEGVTFKMNVNAHEEDSDSENSPPAATQKKKVSSVLGDATKLTFNAVECCVNDESVKVAVTEVTKDFSSPTRRGNAKPKQMPCIGLNGWSPDC